MYYIVNVKGQYKDSDKKFNDRYVVKALSVIEAESILTKNLPTDSYEDFSVVGISQSDIVEIIGAHLINESSEEQNPDSWFKIKTGYKTGDKGGVKYETSMVIGKDMFDAMNLIKNKLTHATNYMFMSCTLSAYIVDGSLI